MKTIDKLAKGNTLNILHIDTQRHWGGGEKQVTYLTHFLDKNKSIKQFILLFKDSALEKKLIDTHLCSAIFHEKYSLGFIYRIHQLINTYNIDLIHTHDSKAHTFAIIASFFSPRTTPILVHRRVSVPIKDNFVSRLKYQHPSINKFICISSHVKNTLSLTIRDSKKIALIPSGIDIKQIESEKVDIEAIKSELSIPKSAKLVLNIGSLKPQKHQDVFIKTAKIILDNPDFAHLDLYFLILGEGESRNDLQRLIDEYKLSQKVRLLGFRQDALRVLKASELLILSSTDEGLGNVIMEAFATKIPVIASRSGGVVDLINHGKTGFLATPLDERSFAQWAKECLLGTNKESVVNAAYTKILAYDMIQTSQSILKLYQSVVANKDKA